MQRPYLISAVGTPLDADDALHDAGLEAHLTDQWRAGVDGVLVAGTMGYMQLLRDETYQHLVRRSSELVAGRGELLVGIGDASLGRTLDRLAYVQRFKVDGVVVLAPAFMAMSEPELLEHFRAVADVAAVPVYLYDLPPLVGRSFSVGLVRRLSEHPNIRGIKCSGPPDLARQLLDEMPAGFRVVMAQPMHLDTFVHGGVREHLDGIFAAAPDWARQTADAAARGEMERAGRVQRQINDLLAAVRAEVGGAFTALLNARGIEGRFAPRPIRQLSEADRDRLLQRPVVQQLLNTSREAAHA